jgi:hypothetical protein
MRTETYRYVDIFSDERCNAGSSARIASSGAREDRDARQGRGIFLDWWMLDGVGDGYGIGG